MKLGELMEAQKPGTYAGVDVDEDTEEAITAFMEANDIPNPIPPKKLHTTLLYSRKHLPEYKAQGKIDPPYIGVPTELEIWKTQDKQANCLVLKYDCPELVERHKFLMKEHGATFDYEQYTPHLTLSYNIGELTLDDIGDPKEHIEQIVISKEYSENLDLNWAKKT